VGQAQALQRVLQCKDLDGVMACFLSGTAQTDVLGASPRKEGLEAKQIRVGACWIGTQGWKVPG
jgi:hypothetical protein